MGNTLSGNAESQADPSVSFLGLCGSITAHFSEFHLCFGVVVCLFVFLFSWRQGLNHIVLAGLELTELCLSLPPERWDKSHVPSR